MLTTSVSRFMQRLVIIVLLSSGLLAGCALTPDEHTTADTLHSHALDPVPEGLPPPAATAQHPPEVITLNPQAPRHYVVKRGDTLWDIAKTFLQNPWHWPEVWVANPHIKNPHLIYPGDVLVLYYQDASPHVAIAERPASYPTVRLSPEVRIEPLPDQEAPIHSIHQFLIYPRVVAEEQLKQAPYILAAMDERMVFGAGDNVYVRGLDAEQRVGSRYGVFRIGKNLHDPDSGELLGREAIPVGDAELIRSGDPATVLLSRSDREALQGDRLLALEDSHQNLLFMPQRPPQDTEGVVISLFDAISQIARFQVAVINRGERDGIEKGHVFASYHAGRVIRDPYASGESSVTLPDERTGLMMVFRTFEKVSYALIMESTLPIREGDKVRSP